MASDVSLKERTSMHRTIPLSLGLCLLAASAGSGLVTARAVEDAPLQFAVYGGSSGSPQVHRSVADGIAALSPAFVIHTGDMVDPALPEADRLPAFSGAVAPVSSRCPIYPVRGTGPDDETLFAELSDSPSPPFYYSFDAGLTHVVVVDTEVSPDEQPAMMTWLREDLAAADAAWTVLACHRSPLAAAGHADRWRCDEFLSVVEQHGVDVVIAGHSPIYERFLPVGLAGAKPVIYLVSAGGGAPGLAPARSPMLAQGYGYAGPQFCWFRVGGNRMDITMRRPDGSVLDRLELVKTDGHYQQEVMDAAVELHEAAVVAPLFADLDAAFDRFPQGGEPVALTLDGSRFPDDAWVTVAAAADVRAGAWEVPATRMRAADRITTQVTPPENLSVGPEGFSPPLWLDLAVEHGGRTWSAQSVHVPFGETLAAAWFPEPEAVPLPRADAALVVDGDPSDWQAVAPVPRPYHDGTPGSVKLCWREEGLYGLAVVADDSVTGNAEAPYAADGLELFLDRDFSRRLVKTGTATQICMGPAPERGPGPGHVVVTYGGGRAEAEAVECAWAPTPDGFVLEFLVPPGVLAPAALAPGTKLGLDFAVNDDGENLERFYRDMRIADGWRTPATWGVIVLE
jgi:hypothetical protein